MQGTVIFPMDNVTLGYAILKDSAHRDEMQRCGKGPVCDLDHTVFDT